MEERRSVGYSIWLEKGERSRENERDIKELSAIQSLYLSPIGFPPPQGMELIVDSSLCK